jgi:hypothetical protein
MARLDPKACGLAFGATWALGLVVFALIVMFSDNYGDTFLSIVSSVYLGYRPDIPGAIIGGIWGFIDGFIGGYVFAWLYNKFLSA